MMGKFSKCETKTSYIVCFCPNEHMCYPVSTLVLDFLDTLVLVSVMQNIVPQIFMFPLDMCVAFLKIVYLCCCRRVC